MCIFTSGTSKKGEFVSATNGAGSISPGRPYTPTPLGEFPIRGTDAPHRIAPRRHHSTGQAKLCPAAQQRLSLRPVLAIDRPVPAWASPAPRPRRGTERTRGGGRAELSSGTASRPGPTALLAGLPGGGERGQAPARTGAAGPFSPRRQRRAGAPRPPQVEGGLGPFPGRPRLLAPAPRCGQQERTAGCLPNPSTFLIGPAT